MVVDGGRAAGDVDPPAGPPDAAPPAHVSVVVVAFGAEPWLERCVEAARCSRDVVVDVTVVDNGCTDGATDRLRGQAGVTVVDAGRNAGFAAGCNIGVAASSSPVVALVNPDALVEPTALAALVRPLDEPDVGLTTCSLRLAEHPDRLNSAGNEIHFLGLSWAGSFDHPAAERPDRRDVLAASGAGMAIRRDLWDELGGFVPEFFAYQEDAELSLRAWLAGHRVVYVPDAVVVHRYEFSRNPTKFFLLDRNRLLLVLTLYEARTLALLAPLLVLQELAMFGVAAAQGWLPQRVRSVTWMVRNRRFVAARRRAAARTRARGDREVAPLMATVVQPGNHPVPSWAVTLQAPLIAWWWAVRRLL